MSVFLNNVRNARRKSNEQPQQRREMTRYRKKPVVIEAVQWDGTYLHAKQLETELGLNTLGMTAHPQSNKVSWWKISTLEDGHVVSAMDWIITGVKGEHYPCKPDIFELTYEANIAQPVQPAEVQRVPLTNAEIWKTVKDVGLVANQAAIAGARAIERAHGIVSEGGA